MLKAPSIVVDEPGLYEERSLDRDGEKTSEFWLAWREGSGLENIQIESATAVRFAKAMDAGKFDATAAGRKIAGPANPVAGLHEERVQLVARLAEIDAELAKCAQVAPPP